MPIPFVHKPPVNVHTFCADEGGDGEVLPVKPFSPRWKRAPKEKKRIRTTPAPWSSARNGGEKKEKGGDRQDQPIHANNLEERPTASLGREGEEINRDNPWGPPYQVILYSRTFSPQGKRRGGRRKRGSRGEKRRTRTFQGPTSKPATIIS